MVAEAVPAKPVSNARTGNFLKISAQNRLSRGLEPLVGRKSIEIQIGYVGRPSSFLLFRKTGS
jgi:hypothetical protein